MSEKPRAKAYVYTRVSTAMQVDGFSLDAQRDEIRRFAELKKTLDNPVCMGKIAYGRRKTEKVAGEDGKTHIVKEKDESNIIISEGVHEAIVFENNRKLAQNGVICSDIATSISTYRAM